MLKRQNFPKKQAKSPPPVKFIEDNGDEDNDDEIQIITHQNTQVPNHKPPGHNRAHKQQALQNKNSTPIKPKGGPTKAPPNAPKRLTEKKKTQKTNRPPRGGRDR